MDDSNNEEDKYNYLLKKDWDEMVLIDDEKIEATDFRKQNVMKFSNMSNLPFNPSNYDRTQTNPKFARRNIKELMNAPTKKEFVRQRDLLTNEQRDDWIKINKDMKQHLETEITIHQADSVTEIGWEPPSEKNNTVVS